MKKHFLISLTILVSTVAFAGNPISNTDDVKTAMVSGKVIDKNSGEEIAGAEINIDNKIIYSDLEGKFSTEINVNNVDAVVKYVSYSDTRVKINPYSYNTITIEMGSK